MLSCICGFTIEAFVGLIIATSYCIAKLIVRVFHLS